MHFAEFEPLAGALVAAVGTGAAVTVGSILFAAAPIITAFTIRLGALDKFVA